MAARSARRGMGAGMDTDGLKAERSAQVQVGEDVQDELSREVCYQVAVEGLSRGQRLDLAPLGRREMVGEGDEGSTAFCPGQGGKGVDDGGHDHITRSKRAWVSGVFMEDGGLRLELCMGTYHASPKLHHPTLLQRRIPCICPPPLHHRPGRLAADKVQSALLYHSRCRAPHLVHLPSTSPALAGLWQTRRLQSAHGFGRRSPSKPLLCRPAPPVAAQIHTHTALLVCLVASLAAARSHGHDLVRPAHHGPAHARSQPGEPRPAHQRGCRDQDVQRQWQWQSCARRCCSRCSAAQGRADGLHSQAIQVSLRTHCPFAASKC